MTPVRVGIVGCGNICSIYFKNMIEVMENLDVTACADIDSGRAEAAAKERSGVKAMSADELMVSPDVELVVNLTVPKAHAEVSLAALEAGKHVYTEKPFAVTREEGQAILDKAAEKDLLVGGAPDTFLGGGLQTCRKLIDDGAIGRPVAATAFMVGHGHEHWHPNVAFHYQVGGGPMMDMGPYYLTALVNSMGPVRRVTGSTSISIPERVATSEALNGLRIPVEVPTHIVGVLDFECGAVGTIITSFDVWAHNLPKLEVHGTEGSLQLPDPNTFGGPVRLVRGRDEWTDVELTHGYQENSRGLGVSDMAAAIRSGRPYRASGGLCFHVLDIMRSIHDASDQGKHIDLASGVEAPAALPVGLAHGKVD